jgi:hypothetical protein
MKISEKQLQLLFLIARDSIQFDSDLFSITLKTRKELVEIIIDQQSNQLKDIEYLINNI